MKLIEAFPMTTASNEQLSSVLGCVKDSLLLTMGNDRLSDLIIMTVETKDAKKLDLGRLVDDYSKE